MESHEQHNQYSPRPIGKGTRLRRLAALVFIVVVVGICTLWFGSAPKVPDQPVRLVRGADGEFISTEGNDNPSGVHFEFHAGELKASNNFNSTLSSSRSGNPRFPSKSITIFNRSDHLLLELVGIRLVDHLEKLSYLKTIDYYPVGHGPEPGGLAPDVFVTLDLLRIAESGLPPVRELDAVILVTAGNRYAKSRASYHDHLAPPVVEFHFEGDLHHVSTTTGISSSSAKYKQVSENIAGEIAKSLAGKFKEFREKDGPLPDLPDSFYPPYQRPEGLFITKAYDLELLVSHRGFLFSSESFWRLTTTRGVDQILPEMELLGKQAGWRTSELHTSMDKIPRLRMVKGSQVLGVFPEEKGTGHDSAPRLSIEREESENEKTSSDEPEQHIFFVHHLFRQSRKDVRRGINAMIDAGAPLKTLLIFEPMFGKEQWRQLVTILEASPPKSPEAWSVLARQYHRRKDEAAAREALRRAWVLLRTAPNPGGLKTKLEQLAKDLEIEGIDDEAVSPELLNELGFIALEEESPIPAIEIGVDEPVHFYGFDEDRELAIASVRVVLEADGAHPDSYSLLHVQSRKRMHSWGKGGMSCSVRIGKSRMAQIEAKRLDGEKRFRLEVRSFP